MTRMFSRWIVAVTCLWGAACAAPVAAAVRVVATIFPLADMVRQIGQNDVEVVTLLPAGASPHTFEPTPAQIREIASADVCVRVGGLDAWTAKLLAARGTASGGAMPVVTLTDGLKLLTSADLHGARGLDPHVWLDPILVRDHAVRLIVDGLSQAAPERRAAFESGAAAYRAALTGLDIEIRATLAPLANRNYVAFHSAWRYFGLQYGLNEVAVVEAFPGKEPSAQEIAGVVRQARAAHARALLIEPQFDPRLAQQIAREFDGVTLVVDPIGGADVPGRNRYIDLMRFNARAFAEGLR
jgi:zinc transport system substrate-binding protein